MHPILIAAAPAPASAPVRSKTTPLRRRSRTKISALKQLLDLFVERVQDADPGLQKVALESMRQEIRTSTNSMTESDLKKYLADILLFLALTMSAKGERESLKDNVAGENAGSERKGKSRFVCSNAIKRITFFLLKRDFSLIDSKAVQHNPGLKSSSVNTKPFLLPSCIPPFPSSHNEQ
ncbi:hypothetical protein VNO80_25661 [Phaseolus coccineus]|uniref:RPN1 N-terminal domain-containing protein n=1 Tax=Phaseolus coccineus TaxID=3886 RepID=A0AAN9LUL8_PHACN